MVHTEELWPLAGLVGFSTLITVLANAEVIACTLASPNYEVAFLLSGAYCHFALVTAGYFIAFPSMSSCMRLLSYISIAKPVYQAMLLCWFKDNPEATAGGVPMESYIRLFELDQPDTVWANVVHACCLLVLFLVLGFLCLKYLYKERR